MEIEAIAHIYTDFKDKFGIPRQSGRAPSLIGKIVFTSKYSGTEAIRGIEEFSHLWLIFGFSESVRDSKKLTVRPPRLGGNKRVGVFASRSPFRPNSLGLSVVRLESVSEDGSLVVSGVDLLNGTPIYDIKPYLTYSDSHPDAFGSYGDEMSGYRLEVVFPPELLEIIPDDKRQAVIECLGDDPRPSYHDDEREYAMRFADFDISFCVRDSVLNVTAVKRMFLND